METYFIVGFKQGLETATTLLPLVGQTIEPNADAEQLEALKSTIRKLREIDPTKEEFIQQIANKTEGFTLIKKNACTKLIDTLDEMIANYKTDSSEE